MLRISRETMNEIIQGQRVFLLERYSEKAVSEAEKHIIQLLSNTNRDLMRAFIGEAGADSEDCAVLNEAFLAITNFLHAQHEGTCTNMSDVQREVWFRKYLFLPPMVIDTVHTA